MRIPSPSKVDLAGEEWTVRYFPRVVRKGKYIAAARVPSKKEVWLSLQDEKGVALGTEDIAGIFSRAVTPIVEENVRNKEDVQ